MNLTTHAPLISVIITTYNYSIFLPKAIESALNQTYTNFEIIVIDDGSVDDTKKVISNYKTVQYFYQQNRGLSSARNAGVKKAKGNYLVFLDADDWLEINALEQNFLAIKNNPETAFISGNYYFLRAETKELQKVSVAITNNHYQKFLESNYVGMHAAVMFQRWVFDEFQYDESLKACEDYDLYLRISRKYPVLHHQKFIATYYFHSKGLSHNYEVMMDAISLVMKKQEKNIKSAEEKQAYAKGLQQWKNYYDLLQKNLQVENSDNSPI